MIQLVDSKLEEYAIANSSSVPSIMEELREYTLANTDMPQMQVGALEGNFLKVLALTARARRIVEVGTFTGYSTLMMASALPEDGELFTCELDDKHADIAQSFFDRVSFGSKITIKRGPASQSIDQIEGPLDMVFIDADKSGYIEYFDQLLPKMRPGGLIVADNVLWSGRILQEEAEADESTRALQAFNRHVTSHEQLSRVMVTVRDGMTLISC